MENCNESPSVSIIVPIYNVEEYLEKCLNSIINQTFQNFEVILINDGAMDNSAQIAMHFAEKYENFVYLSQSNQGLSAARNNAMLKATGEYLTFVDSDDCIEPNYLQRLYETAKEFDTDIVICGFKKHWLKSGVKIKKYFRKKSGVFTSQQLMHSLIKDMTIQYYVWNKLYRRDLFVQNGITFPEMRFEDIGTVPKLFYYSNKIAIIPDYLYIYSKRENSIISELSAQNLNDYIKAICMLRLFLEEKKSFKRYKFDFIMLKAKASVASYPWTVLLHVKQMNYYGLNANLKSLTSRLMSYSRDYIPLDCSDINLPTITVSPKRLTKEAEKVQIKESV